MKKLHVPSALLLLLGAVAVPAAAGTVYVPLASSTSNGGASYTTQVWVTNPDTATHHFTTTFIEQGTGGSSATTSGNLFVNGATTVVLTGVAPQGQSGLLAISSASTTLLVAAQIQVTDENGTVVGMASVPALTQDTAVASGGFTELQGLQRGPGGIVTDYSLVNMGSADAQCTVGALTSAGSLLTVPATLAVAAFSRRDFPDVLSTVGLSQGTAVRIVATCNQPFYAFATVYNPGGPQIAVVGPSTDLSGTVGPALPASTSGGGGGSGTGSDDVTFSVSGTFLNATQSDSEQLYTLPAKVNVPYEKATIDWDMHIGTFPTGLFTGVMAFRRPDKSYALREPFCAVQIVNRNSKTILDLGLETSFERTNGPWKENGDYHMTLTYDLTIKQCSLVVSQSGTVIYTIAGPANWFDMSADANPLEVDFGQTGIGDGAYYPPIGWSFANLNVVLVPTPQQQ